jgi:hypothetical protein
MRCFSLPAPLRVWGKGLNNDAVALETLRVTFFLSFPKEGPETPIFD